MKNYINQYKVLFWLSWISFYLIFPAWRIGHIYYNPYNLAITKLMVYFTISAYLMHRYFNTLIVDKPFIIKINDWFIHMKNNLLFVLICCLAVVLHINILSPVVTTGEEYNLSITFKMYDFLNSCWHRLFNFPIQYFFWALIGLLVLLLLQKKIINFTLNHISARFYKYKSNNAISFLFILFLFIFFNAYTDFFPQISRYEVGRLLREPPVSRIIYVITFLAVGMSQIGPRVIQLIFYILSAVYLYRTIHLFHEKEAALLGATIYLFSPIIFSYASLASLASGTIFFINLISYYFLRFIKNEDNRDLILTAYFIGIGFLYRREIVLMFVICFTYFLFSRIKKGDWKSILHINILLFSLVPIYPWLKIGNVQIGATGLDSGMYALAWSNLIKFDELITYSLMIQSQMSWIISLLFLFSFIFILFVKRNELSLFFGLLFIAYYLFFTIMVVGKYNHRYALALYPAIAVFLAQCASDISQRIRWKHTFKLVCSVITIYLIVICLIPRSSSDIITYKYKDNDSQYFPYDKAADWISKSTNNEKILVAYFKGEFMFYLDYFGNRINQERLLVTDYESENRQNVYPLQNLKKFCRSEKISFIMFPYSPRNSLPRVEPIIERGEMADYLKENMDMDNEFITAAKFNIDDNYIFIYKVKETLSIK